MPEGIEVDQASDGEEGLERTLTTDYEVVVFDLQLPKVDGITVLRRLLSARPGQAIIVSTGRDDPSTRSECFKAGARVFFAKPFSLADLVARVAAARGSCGVESP